MYRDNLRTQSEISKASDHGYLLAVVSDTGVVVFQGPFKSREERFDI